MELELADFEDEENERLGRIQELEAQLAEFQQEVRVFLCCALIPLLSYFHCND